MTDVIDDRPVTIYATTIHNQLFILRLPRWLAAWLRREFGGARAWAEAQINTIARYQQALGNPTELSKQAVCNAIHATALELFAQRECPDF